MQHLRQLLATAAIICALTYSAFAGAMNYPVAPPNPTPTPEVLAASTTEEAPSGTAASAPGTEDTSYNYLGEVALAILESLNIGL